MTAPVQTARERLDPLVFGMVLFLASEVVFFGSFFAAYFLLRTRSGVWPPPDVELGLLLPLAMTGILLVSSYTAHEALGHVERARRPAAARWLVVTALLGAIFLALKFLGWAGEDFTISSHAYGSIFFGLSGLHAAHLGVGIGILLFLAARLAGPRARGDESFARAAVTYWHFVDVVWLAVFATLYLVR